MTVFQNIKKIINKKRSTVKEVSENIGLSQRGLGLALNNQSLKVVDLLDIANFLKVDVCEFFSENSYSPEKDEIKSVNEPNDKYQKKNEVKELKERISELKNALKDKEEIIKLIKDKKDEKVKK